MNHTAAAAPLVQIGWWDLASESCLPPHETRSFLLALPWNSFNVQLVIIAFLSTINNVWVLLFHWLYPPHPKFLLLNRRRLCIRAHVLSGTIEIVAFCVALVMPRIPMGTWSSTHYAVYVQVAAAAVHILTALLQTPIVFGTRVVMVPAYVACVAMKSYCAIDLLFNPSCAVKVLRPYNIHSIYTWCRALVYLFKVLGIFADANYTISIILAGFLTTPSLGPSANFIYLLVIIAYYLFLKHCGSPEYLAMQTRENARDLFDSPRFQGLLETVGHNSMLSAAGGADSKAATSSCPFAGAEKDQRHTMLRSLFDLLDVDNSGTVSLDELRNFGNSVKRSATWTTLIDTHIAKNGGAANVQPMTFEQFRQVFGSGMLMQSPPETDSADLRHVASSKATYDEKARFIFNMLDRSHQGDGAGDGHIDSHELTYLLVQYSLPPRDVHDVMAKYGGSDGRLSFNEFKKGFRPLILFQVGHLKENLQEMEREKQREKLRERYVLEHDDPEDVKPSVLTRGLTRTLSSMGRALTTATADEPQPTLEVTTVPSPDPSSSPRLSSLPPRSASLSVGVVSARVAPAPKSPNTEMQAAKPEP